MLNLSSGRSEKDRISFYTSNNGITAIRNANGNISIEFGKQNSPLKATLELLGIFGTLSAIKAYLLIPLIENKTIGLIWYLIPTFFYLFLLVFSIVSVRKKSGINFLKNHGAEHMVFTAYKKLKRIPTIEEAKNFSRINSRCGINIYSAFITSQLIGFLVYVYTDYKISEILLFLAPLFLSPIFPFNFIGELAQFFTTAKPEDSNIELAIAALSALEKRENLVDSFIDSIRNSSVFSSKDYEKNSHDKWHCNGDCQFFDDFAECPGEKNIDNNSEKTCPYYSPEI